MIVTKDELDLVTTDDLLATLSRRFDSYILTVRMMNTQTDGELLCYYGGGWATALGLCEYTKQRLLKMQVAD